MLQYVIVWVMYRGTNIQIPCPLPGFRMNSFETTLHEPTQPPVLCRAPAVFVASAVGCLCTCQGLPNEVVHSLIEKTLEAGNNGPAVSLWVMHSLLAVAETECKRNMDATSVRHGGVF